MERQPRAAVTARRGNHARREADAGAIAIVIAPSCDRDDMAMGKSGDEQDTLFVTREANEERGAL